MLYVIIFGNENYIGFSLFVKLIKYMFVFYIGVGYNCLICGGYILYLYFFMY